MDENVIYDKMWRASSYSGGSGECVEVTLKSPKSIAVRDSKNKRGSFLVFTLTEWERFTYEIKGGKFDAN